MTPQITNGLDSSDTYSYREPNLTYRVGEKTVTGKITNLESIQQSIYHILSTERFSNPIYDDDYGIELEQYIGKDLGTIRADIENTLRDALTQDDRITDLLVTNVEKSTKQENACLVEFTVYTIYGSLEELLNVVQ
jgi:phage baseplate assembly protein W